MQHDLTDMRAGFHQRVRLCRLIETKRLKDNGFDFSCLSDIDGGLIGGASLKAADFLAIAAAA